MLSKNIDQEKIKQLIESGYKNSQIAKDLEISSATVSYWRKKLGFSLYLKRYDWKDIQLAYDAGLSYAGLYQLFGVTKRSLQVARNRGDFVPRKINRTSLEQRKLRKRAIDREAWMRYYSRKKYQTPADENLSALQKFYENCPIGYEVDHIIPISKGGSHSLNNLQYLTKTENRRKSNKIL